MTVTLAELARRFQGKARGNADVVIEGVASLQTAGPRDIAYVSDRKYLPLLATTKAGVVILTEQDETHYSGSALVVADPHLCFARVAQLLYPLPEFRPGTHPTAVVSPAAKVASSAWIGPNSVVEADAVIGEGAYIGPGCYIGSEVTIGEFTRLTAHVVIGERCVIGNKCLFKPGAVIGSDGFGFAKDGERWQKIPQIGRVLIGNEVEVGANTTIDRGALNDTVIGDGVKLDNLIQIAHNVKIGENTAMAGCSGIAGSAVIGKRCTIGGQAGIAGHIELADDVHITACSLVMSSITKPGVYSASIKAEPVEKWRRNAVRLYHLDEIARRLARLEERLQQLFEEQKN
jgi:UDP-3-O-[3-hydroxymyristoyl] glucosamine N-acyltransferase